MHHNAPNRIYYNSKFLREGGTGEKGKKNERGTEKCRKSRGKRKRKKIGGGKWEGRKVRDKNCPLTDEILDAPLKTGTH